MSRRPRSAFGTAIAVLVIVLGAANATAGDVYLRVSEGRVTLLADAASLREIFQEWVRVTGAEVVNAEKLPSTPITLRLVDEPERVALATLLRDAGGYILANRPAAERLPDEIHLPGRVDRILILGIPKATGTAPAPPARSLADVVTAALPDLGHTQAAEGNTAPPPEPEPAVAAPPPMARTPGFVSPPLTAASDAPSVQSEAPTPSPRQSTRSRSESASSRSDSGSRGGQSRPSPAATASGSSRPGTISPVPAPTPQQPPQVPGIAISSGGERTGESGIPPE
jgi:hypothetical protein